jgi:arylsulfatase A-like enzyme/Flp pilus assembly protein TadD
MSDGSSPLSSRNLLRFCSRLMLGVGIAWSATACNRIGWARPTPTGPNVLLVTVDTLRADYVGATAKHNTQTPTLDGLAAEGTLFENASATVPLTLPSHTSMFTGKYPPHHGVRHNSIHRAPLDAETLAEGFQAAGYTTAAFVAAAVLDRDFQLDQGFGEYHDKMSERLSAGGGFPQLNATEISDAAIEFLARTERPFFLWVHYYDVHAVYEPPEPYRSRLAPDLYAGEVAYVDHELGRLLTALRESGRYDDTVILATADHGEGLGEHGEGTHSYLIYESTMHVPLILRGPGVPVNKRVAEVVSNASVAPTLLSLAGLPPLRHTDVPDLAPLMRGEGTGTGWAYAESLAGQLDHGWAPIHSIRTLGEKFIHAPRPELFDLSKDPGELANLLQSDADSYRARVDVAQQRIQMASAGERKSSKVAIDAETRARIEALGYVVPTGDVEIRSDAPDPKDTERYGQIAFKSQELTGLGRWAEAEAVTLQALRYLPRSATLHENLARIYLGTGRYEAAIAAAREAVTLAPESPIPLGLLGELYFRVGDYPSGIAAMERALALDPNQPGAHFALIWKRRLGGSIEEAEAHAEKGLALGGHRPSLVETCGEAWEMVGEYERAIAAYELGLERAKDETGRLHMRLAIQYARLGDWAKFQRHLAMAGDAAQDVRLATRLAIVFAAREELAVAEPLLRSIVMRDRSRTASRVLARMLRTHGRIAEADRIAPATAPPPRLEPVLDGLAPAAAPRG